jgi:hypothetical protein
MQSRRERTLLAPMFPECPRYIGGALQMPVSHPLSALIADIGGIQPFFDLPLLVQRIC